MLHLGAIPHMASTELRLRYWDRRRFDPRQDQGSTESWLHASARYDQAPSPSFNASPSSQRSDPPIRSNIPRDPPMGSNTRSNEDNSQMGSSLRSDSPSPMDEDGAYSQAHSPFNVTSPPIPHPSSAPHVKPPHASSWRGVSSTSTKPQPGLTSPLFQGGSSLEPFPPREVEGVHSDPRSFAPPSTLASTEASVIEAGNRGGSRRWSSPQGIGYAHGVVYGTLGAWDANLQSRRASFGSEKRKGAEMAKGVWVMEQNGMVDLEGTLSGEKCVLDVGIYCQGDAKGEDGSLQEKPRGPEKQGASSIQGVPSIQGTPSPCLAQKGADGRLLVKETQFRSRCLCLAREREAQVPGDEGVLRFKLSQEIQGGGRDMGREDQERSCGGCGCPPNLRHTLGAPTVPDSERERYFTEKDLRQRDLGERDLREREVFHPGLPAPSQEHLFLEEGDAHDVRGVGDGEGGGGGAALVSLMDTTVESPLESVAILPQSTTPGLTSDTLPGCVRLVSPHGQGICCAEIPAGLLEVRRSNIKLDEVCNTGVMSAWAALAVGNGGDTRTRSPGVSRPQGPTRNASRDSKASPRKKSPLQVGASAADGSQHAGADASQVAGADAAGLACGFKDDALIRWGSGESSNSDACSVESNDSFRSRNSFRSYHIEPQPMSNGTARKSTLMQEQALSRREQHGVVQVHSCSQGLEKYSIVPRSRNPGEEHMLHGNEVNAQPQPQPKCPSWQAQPQAEQNVATNQFLHCGAQNASVATARQPQLGPSNIHLDKLLPNRAVQSARMQGVQSQVPQSSVGNSKAGVFSWAARQRTQTSGNYITS